MKLSAESSTLRLALSAVSLSSVANRVNDRVLIRQGAQLYGRALALLNTILQDPKAAAKDDAIIPTIMFLSMYEVSVTFSELLLSEAH